MCGERGEAVAISHFVLHHVLVRYVGHRLRESPLRGGDELARLLPFAALGVLLGHLLTADVIGPATGGVVSLLALVSGNWFPLSENSLLHDIAQFLPSYWLVQATRASLDGHGWDITGWAVITSWTLALAILARAVYRRDTERV